MLLSTFMNVGFMKIFHCPSFLLHSLQPAFILFILMNFFSNMATLFLIEFNPFISTFNEACSSNRLKGHYLEIVRKSAEFFFLNFKSPFQTQKSLWRKIWILITKIANWQLFSSRSSHQIDKI